MNKVALPFVHTRANLWGQVTGTQTTHMGHSRYKSAGTPGSARAVGEGDERCVCGARVIKALKGWVGGLSRHGSLRRRNQNLPSPSRKTAERLFLSQILWCWKCIYIRLQTSHFLFHSMWTNEINNATPARFGYQGPFPRKRPELGTQRPVALGLPLPARSFRSKSHHLVACESLTVTR